MIKNLIRKILLNKFYLMLGLVSFVCLGIVVLLVAAWQPVVEIIPGEPEMMEYTCPSANNSDDKRDNEALVVVDIGGAVVTPGIYQLSASDRLADLLQMAGGLRADLIDVHLLQKQLTLAQLLKDGQKYYVPFRGESWTNLQRLR